jgi:hypothetical protein
MSVIQLMLVKVKGAVKSTTAWCITTLVARPPGPTARSRDYAGVEKKGAREKPETVIPTSR